METTTKERKMQTSGYHTPGVIGWAKRVGAWTLEVVTLPDGRTAIDYHNSFNGQRTRHYFETRQEAVAEYKKFETR